MPRNDESGNDGNGEGYQAEIDDDGSLVIRPEGRDYEAGRADALSEGVKKKATIKARSGTGNAVKLQFEARDANEAAAEEKLADAVESAQDDGIVETAAEMQNELQAQLNDDD